MRKTIIPLVALALLVSAGLSYAQQLAGIASPVTVTINDKVGKNQFVWISEAPLENIKGSSEAVSGSFAIDPHDLTKMHGSVSTASRTMTTGNATRDRHLVSAEWIDVARYPAISFAIQSVSNIKTAGAVSTGTAVGSFTLHGVTKKISIPFKMTYIPESDKTRQRAPGDLVMISAEFSIALKDFNIAGTQDQVGSKVGETIKITAQLFGNATKTTPS